MTHDEHITWRQLIASIFVLAMFTVTWAFLVVDESNEQKHRERIECIQSNKCNRNM